MKGDIASYAAYCDDQNVSPPPPRGGPVKSFKDVYEGGWTSYET